VSDHALLELRRVSRSFGVRHGLFGQKSLKAVDDVSLRVGQGEALGIVGESGCGKTTLLRIMLGLIPPSTGEVLIEGRPIATRQRRELARKIQLVFQDPYSALNPRRSIEAIVGQPLSIQKVGNASDRRRRVLELLELVGLPAGTATLHPGELSGGQRQRVVIARALALTPGLLVCDEPTSALDVSIQAQILNLLLDLKRELGLTLVIVSHNLAVVEHIATRMAVMYLGRVVEVGDTASVLGDPKHPYTRVLLRSVLTPAPRAGIPQTRLRGAPPSPMEACDGCRFHPRCPEVLPICSSQDPAPVNCRGVQVACHLVNTQANATPVS